MVYDLRVMKVMNPVQLVIEPCFIHYIPMCSSVVAIASQVRLNNNERDFWCFT